jgi:L,D-peptidoglycan transpeptidase YkuD (ErfK/YbiS/YcfS/YnhG family)
MRKLLASGLVIAAVLLGAGVVRSLSAGAAAVPPHHPTKLKNVAGAKQLIVVTGKSRTSTYATAYTYQLSADGRTWKAKFAAMPARVGYAGWAWAAQRVQDTGTTPIGTFRITTAFGIQPNPGTKVKYTRVDGNDYWVGDNKDAKTYNLFQPSASAKRTWRKGEAERLASYPTQYAYSAVIDFNRPAASTVTWNSAKGQYVTSKPANTKRGSAIFLHVNGSGSTAGCVSLRRADMVAVLKWLDPALAPRIVMAPAADIGKA